MKKFNLRLGWLCAICLCAACAVFVINGQAQSLWRRMLARTSLPPVTANSVTPPEARQVVASAHGDELWRDVTDNAFLLTTQPAQRSQADSVRYLQLNQDALIQLLRNAPLEFTEAATQSPSIVPLPLPDGRTLRFRVVESPLMEAALANRYAQLKTYSGTAQEDATMRARFLVSPAGLRATILSAAGMTSIEPITGPIAGPIAGQNVYASATQRDLQDQGLMQCLTDSPEAAPQLSPAREAITGDNVLRKYRLAVAATAEYTQFVGGGTVAGALAAITTTLNAINLIYERDLAIRLTLIANNDAIIFTDTNTDGYTSDNLTSLLAENQTKLDTVIGTANYDVGHVFDSGTIEAGFSGAGLATIPSVCNATNKARGATIVKAQATLLSSLPGSLLTLYQVAHEFGHQFGATHTFNGTTANCQTNRNAATAYEPASGSTLMAFPTACTTENLGLTAADLYFHTTGIDQVTEYITGGTGNTCAAPLTTGNSAPLVSAGANFTIPAQTPFELTATASDANNDALTYTWEQVDLGAASGPGAPNASLQDSTVDDGARPLFRSQPPSSSPTRLFPKLSSILTNTTATLGEALPTTNRTMNFRVTARDNKNGGGATNSSAMKVTVAAGTPFAVTAPNTPVTWQASSCQTVTWNVAGTDRAPVVAPNVQILLSGDGGNSFDYVLAESTPNDGSEQIIVPVNIPSTTNARIKVKAVGNIFFDLSNTSFTIQNNGTPDVALTKTHSGSFSRGQIGATYTLTVQNVGNTATTGLVTVTDTLPTGLTATAISGNGWECLQGTLTCTRPGTGADALAANTSYPPITLTVNVAANAPVGVNSVTNRAVVSGGGQFSCSGPSGNDLANDPTTITGNCSVITISPAAGALPGGKQFADYSQVFAQNGGSGAITWSVSAGALPAGLSLNPSTGVLSGKLNSAGNFSFTIMATDAGACTGSAAYTLNVCSLPVVNTAPVSRTVCLGSNVVFSVEATNATSLQWRRNGVNVTGATSNTLTLNSVTTANDGDYDVVLTNGCGTTVSPTATLTVVSMPTILAQPQSQSTTTGSAVTFNVTATGAGLRFQWRRNGANISNATSRSLTLNAVTPADTANYDVAISSDCGSVTSSAASLTVTNPVPVITALTPAVVRAGSDAFTLVVSGGNFVNGAVVLWNNSPRATTFVSSTQLTAVIPASDLTTATFASVTVFNPEPGGGTSTARQFNVTAGTDLTVTMTAAPGNVTTNSQVTYTITVTNKGPSAANSVTVSDSLPALLSFVSCSATNGGVCGGTGNNRTISYSSLASGASSVITLVAQVNCVNSGGGTLSNTVGVASAIPELVPADNAASASVNLTATPAQLTLTVDGGGSSLTFGTVAAGGITSGAFTLENTGCVPTTLTFNLSRTGSDVTSGKITNTDDSATFPIRLINANGSETALNFINGQAQVVLGAAARQRFRQLFAPRLPAPAGRTTNLSAAQVIPNEITATLRITPSNGTALNVPLTGNVTTRAILINPLVTTAAPLIALSKSGNEFSVECSVFDPNLDLYLVRYQFVDGNGANVGLPVDAGIDFSTSSLARGQSVTLVKKFTGANARPNVARVRVTIYDREANEVVLSAPIGTVVGRVVNVSAASFSANAVASGSIAAAFGNDMATSVQSANTLPLPTELGGVTVSVRDSLGVERAAPLFFVSPNQINYQLPEGTAAGEARISIVRDNQVMLSELLTITTLAPSLFSADASGTGVAAASALRIKPDNTLVYEPVARFDAALNRPVTIPIDLSSPSDQMYLTLFGTGVRFVNASTTVTARIGAIDVPVIYAGAQGGFVGLDQINLQLPRSLAGAGDVEIVLTVDGKVANTVRVNIR